MEVTIDKNLNVKVTGKDKGYIETQSVDAVLLYKILKNLEVLNKTLTTFINKQQHY